MLMGRKWDWKIKSYQFINWLQAGRIWSHSFLREGPQRMAEGQTSKTEIFYSRLKGIPLSGCG